MKERTTVKRKKINLDNVGRMWYIDENKGIWTLDEVKELVRRIEGKECDTQSEKNITMK
jgi:hypothetical protein